MARTETDAGGALGAEFATFSRRTSPRFITAVLGALIVARLAMARWSVEDAIVAAAIVAAQPFTEWLIHVYVLHARPRRVLGRTVDLLVARKHRAHHRDPRDLDLIFVPLPVIIPGLLGIVGAVLAFAPHRQAGLTGLVTGTALLLTYEWTHYLIHSRYRPRSRYFRYIHRAHRLHHFRNERYWFGVTIHLADHALRTFPARDAVPASPTARTLGVDAA